jgi:hypothetical protein
MITTMVFIHSYTSTQRYTRKKMTEKPVTLLCIGMAGSGKTTFMQVFFCFNILEITFSHSYHSKEALRD